MITTNKDDWFIHQLKGFILIMAIGLMLAITTNTIREDPLPWVKTQRLVKKGDKLPYLPLSAAEVPDLTDYLGIPPDKKIFTIADVHAEVLVFEVLNAFCFPCQTHALTLSKAYKAIEERPDLKGRIKIIGVALGNTETIAKGFVQDYGIPFPVISDPDTLTEKILGPGIRVPFTLFIRPDAGGKLGLVAETHIGVIDNAGVLLHDLSGLLSTEPETAEHPKLL